jgi:hypothetical protein
MKLGEINRTMVASGIASMHKGRDNTVLGWARQSASDIAEQNPAG